MKWFLLLFFSLISNTYAYETLDTQKGLLEDNWYFSGGATMSFENYDSSQNVDGTVLWGFDTRIGVRLSRVYSLEVEYLGAYDAEVNNGRGQINSHNITINSKFNLSGNLYNWGKLSGLIKTGAQINDASGNANVGDSTGFLLGAGLMFTYFLEKDYGLFVEANYYLPFGDADQFDLIPIVFGVEIRY